MWHLNIGMFYLFLGYAGAAAAFYLLIAKTAKVEPELMLISQPTGKTATIIDLTEQAEKKAA